MILQQGLPQQNVLSIGDEVDYYKWDILLSDKEINLPLIIGVTLLSGGCKIFLSRNPSIINSCGFIGCPIGLYDISKSCSDNSPLIINPNDEYYINSGTYYISICNTETEIEHAAITTYSIITYTSYSITYLSNGIPLWDSITLNKYKYYTLLTNEQDIISLDVSITPNSDNEEVPFTIKGIISTTRSRPIGDKLNNEYEIEWINGKEAGGIFSISENDEKFIKSSKYFISLYSIKNTDYYGTQNEMTYTINAYATASNLIQYILLMDNIEQIGVIYNENIPKYYSFKSHYLKKIKFIFDIFEGDIDCVCIISSNTENSDKIPSKNNHEYKIEPKNINYLLMNNPCNYCSYLIAVYAKTTSQKTIYSILL